MNNTQKLLLQVSLFIGWMFSRGCLKTIYYTALDPAPRERFLVEVIVSVGTGWLFWTIYSRITKRSTPQDNSKVNRIGES